MSEQQIDGYEAPSVEQVNAEHDPAVTCAMVQVSDFQ